MEEPKILMEYDGNMVRCHLCNRTFNTRVLGAEGVIAFHARAHLREEFDLIPEKSDRLNALLDLVVRWR